MKRLRLSELRKKKASFYRNIGVVDPYRMRKTTIDYIVERAYEALPKYLQGYIEDPEQLKKVTANMIAYSGRDAKINPYEAIRQVAAYSRKKSGDNTRFFLWRRFMQEEPSLYAKYNSYMYRKGYSGSRWWLENATLTQRGSYIDAIAELPETGRVLYQALEMEFDFSGQDFSANLF